MTKYQQIEECLRGNDDSMIDLWHLRQLSLSHGGLLDPKLRKRVWPLLTQALSSSSAPPLLLSAGIPDHELRRIQKDVKHTVWNVKAHFRSQQQHKTIASFESSKQSNDTDKRVTFSEDEQHPRADAETSSISHSNEEGNGHSKAEQWQENDDHWYDDHKNNRKNNNNNNNNNDHRSVSSFAGTTHSRRSTTTSNSSKLSRRGNKASKHEQRTVMNVMVNCLRTMPPLVSSSSSSSSSSSELAIPPAAHRRHYYTGFHDLTALIMVNVESLSISALLLTKLSTYHLRDALRKDRVALDAAMKLIFFPLLKNIDSDLFQHLVGRDVDEIKKLCSFFIYVISNWFATNIIDIASASRLIDLFLVSHATAPIYTTIAILVYYRETILSSSDMNGTVQSVPLFRLDCDDEDGPSASASLAIVEIIVSMTLRYMKQYPPDTLLELNTSTAIWSDETRDQLLAKVGSIAMLHDKLPTWCLTGKCPNEWTTIQNAIRGVRDVEIAVVNPSPASSSVKHSLALVALGIAVPVKQYEQTATSRNSRNVLVTLAVVFSLIMLRYSPTLFRGNRYGESAHSTQSDTVPSCLDAQLLESIGIGTTSDTHDDTMEIAIEMQSNMTVDFSKVFAAHEKVQEMLVPSATDSPLPPSVIEDRGRVAEVLASKDVDVGVAIISTSIPESDIEIAYEHQILECINVRMSKIESRIRAIITSPVVEHLRQSLDLRAERVIATVCNASTDGCSTDPMYDIELAFEQNILDIIHFRALKMEQMLQKLLSSPQVQRLQQKLRNATTRVATFFLLHYLQQKLHNTTTNVAIIFLSVSNILQKKIIQISHQTISSWQQIKRKIISLGQQLPRERK